MSTTSGRTGRERALTVFIGGVIRNDEKMKLQHRRAFQANLSPKAAPMLEFSLIVTAMQLLDAMIDDSAIQCVRRGRAHRYFTEDATLCGVIADNTMAGVKTSGSIWA